MNRNSKTVDQSGGLRADLIYCARVYLSEAKRRRNQPAFHATLLRWAANTRQKAAACVAAQRELFA